MGLLNLFKRHKPEQRNFTSQAMAARFAEIQGQAGVGDLTATTQTCVGLWENTLAQADIDGTQSLSPRLMAMAGRSLGLTGEAVFLIGEGRLIPAYEWDLSTRDGEPTAYRLTLPDVTGGRSVTVLAPEVIHFRIGSRPSAPWRGSSPLHRASLTAGLLDAIERALAEVYTDSPLGSQVMSTPEDPDGSNANLQRSFRGQRGRVLLPESTNVTAAGGPAPQQDWKPADLSPDLSRSMTTESHRAAHNAIVSAYGVLPALLNDQSAGPVIREARSHLVQMSLQPIAELMAQEATDKLGAGVTIDALTPTQAMDTGARARALQATVKALSEAKEAGVEAGQIQQAMNFSGVE
ncbi:phage portal protein [Salinisphaera sp. USBA-960]|nr:phage portal protein [Salifodinibacter halophilus]NNC27271.1 phage portal protein [Salifodinibacter halophilus]